jgi:hypothetical protein
MAKFDYGGGCPCGLYRDCIEQCENYVAPGEVLTKYVLEAQKRALEKKMKERATQQGPKQYGYSEVTGSWWSAPLSAEFVEKQKEALKDIRRRMENNQTVTDEEVKMAEKGIVGKCGCGAFPQCLPGCAQYGRDEEKEAEKEYNRARLEAMKDMLGAAQPAKAKTNVVWVVGRDWEPTSKLMFFWREEDAKRAVKLLGRVGDDEGRKISLSVWSVEVEG